MDVRVHQATAFILILLEFEHVFGIHQFWKTPVFGSIVFTSVYLFLLNSLVQQILKFFVGEFSPFFLSLCVHSQSTIT